MTAPIDTFERRFWAKVEKRGPHECWSWTGATNGDGYGYMTRNGRTAYAHRVSYEFAIGPIPEGLQLDHLCRVRNCVNPAHLEAVTSAENTLRGNGACARNARKTHCKHGHEFTDDNIAWSKKGRACLTCKRLRERDAWQRRLTERAALQEALEVASDLLRGEGYDTDPDYRQEWQTISDGLAALASSQADNNT